MDAVHPLVAPFRCGQCVVMIASPHTSGDCPMIEITVNGKAVSLPESATLEKVLESVDVPPNYLAVELNGEVGPREKHVSQMVQVQDELEVVTLVGGG